METASDYGAGGSTSVGAAADKVSERDARILELASRGVLAAAIAPQVGCSEMTVRKVLRKHGLDGKTTCSQCGSTFKRRTNERVCPECLAPLRRLRAKSGLTAAALARRVGCRANTISELERDLYQPALALAEALALGLGADVLDTFPSLEITKGEAQRVLGMTSRGVKRLCDSGDLPCDGDGEWHRIPYAAVRRLADERERFRAEWISFHAAEHEYGLPWWVLRRLEREGRFGDDVTIIANAKRVTRYVRRDTLAQVRQNLADNHRRNRCPNCGRWVKLGRKAHARCLAHLYWKIGADPAARRERRREHVESVRSARTIADAIRWYKNRFSREPSREQIGRWSGRKGGGRPALAAVDPEWEAKALEVGRIHQTNPKLGERALAKRTEVSRRQVREMLAWLDAHSAS
jgi:transcriptional regulator with XRE-family HTH domain/predicted RNA-binding Zn-ribbon protein involved in translation (DUF1610 family)